MALGAMRDEAGRLQPRKQARNVKMVETRVPIKVKSARVATAEAGRRGPLRRQVTLKAAARGHHHVHVPRVWCKS